MSLNSSIDLLPAFAADGRPSPVCRPGRLAAAALGAFSAICLVACEGQAAVPPNTACVPAPISLTFAVEDSNGLVPAGTAALAAVLADELKAGDDFGVVRLSGRRGLPASRVPGDPCADIAPAQRPDHGVGIGEGVSDQMTAVAEVEANDSAAEARIAVDTWKREVHAALETLAGGPLQSDYPSSDETGVCAQDGWAVGPLSRVAFAAAPYRPVLILSGCQAQYTSEQPRLPAGVFSGVTILVADAVGPVDAETWFGHTGARVIVIPANRRADLAAALDGVRRSPLPSVRADLAPVDASSVLGAASVVPFLSMASRMGDTILLAALGLLTGLAVLAAYGILGALVLEPIVFVRDRFLAGVRAVIRWGRALTGRLRASDPWHLAESLRVRASGDGDIAEDILQAGVLAASTVTGFLLIAVGAGLVGMHVVAGVRTALPYVLGGTLVLGAGFAFHHLRHGPRAERKWALFAIGLSIGAGVLIAAAKGADLRVQEGVREAVLARREYQPSALVSFLRGFAPNAFILVASAQVITVAALTDFKVVGRSAAFVGGSLLAGLTLVPALLYFAAFGLPVAGLLGALAAPFALLAVFPAKIREWMMLAWGHHQGQRADIGDHHASVAVLPSLQPLLSEVTPIVEQALAREKGVGNTPSTPDSSIGIF